jgi:hypothetical protein
LDSSENISIIEGIQVFQHNSRGGQPETPQNVGVLKTTKNSSTSGKAPTQVRPRLRIQKIGFPDFEADS